MTGYPWPGVRTSLSARDVAAHELTASGRQCGCTGSAAFDEASRTSVRHRCRVPNGRVARRPGCRPQPRNPRAVGVDDVRVFAPLPDQVTVVARRHPTDPLRADIVIVDAENTACVQLLGARFGSLTPGRGPLDQIGPHFYEEVWDLRDALSNATLQPVEQTATLVVAVGDRPHSRARELSDAIPHGGYYDCTGSRGGGPTLKPFSCNNSGRCRRICRGFTSALLRGTSATMLPLFGR